MFRGMKRTFRMTGLVIAARLYRHSSAAGRDVYPV